jgi:Flp pilus assembly protein TadB
MIWIVAVVVVLIVVLAISGASKKAEEAQKRQEFNVQAESRINAYVDLLKRTGATPETAGMTENEVRDFIQRNIREYASERKGGDVFGVLIMFAVFITGMVLAVVNKSYEPLIFGGILSVGSAVFVVKAIGKHIEKKYRRRGLDINQLKIES